MEFDNEQYEKSAINKSKIQPIISDFGISKLYGYRDISFSTHSSTTILIAKNGTGKTTLLGALNALLNFEVFKFKDILFKSIYCTISGEKIQLSKEDISKYLKNKNSETAHSISLEWGIDIDELIEFCIQYPLISHISQDRHETLIQNEIYQGILRSSRHNKADSIKTIIKIKKELTKDNPVIAFYFSQVEKLLEKYEIVYLPTYRRIEVPLDDKQITSPYRSRRQPTLPIQQDSIFSGDIHFGLSDISDRLSRLSQEIIIKCNNGYRDISANIINELIDGEYKTKANIESLPTMEELKLFFTRIKLSKSRFNPRSMGPYLELNSPNLERLYPINNVPEESRVFLTYFLNQLGLVIETIKAVENPISGFIEVCNKYLTKNDFSAEHRSKENKRKNSDKDSKKLVLNRENLSIKAYNTYTDKPIHLEYLSSGEKQMISIFSKLFLYPLNKIVLIDEPEISLSINWQSRILVDIVNSSLCSQLISITHSPFVFENVLEPFAKSLKVKVHLDEASSDDTELGGLDWLDGGIDD